MATMPQDPPIQSSNYDTLLSGFGELVSKSGQELNDIGTTYRYELKENRP